MEAAAAQPAAAGSALPSPARILVLGGTQFMGRLMIERLLELGHDVTMSNRGVSDNPFAGDGRVALLQCDRLDDRPRFVELLSAASSAAPFDAVIDFTGFHRDNITDVVKALHNVSAEDVVRKVQHYVYISTDSVYMAAQRPFPSLSVGSGLRAGGVREDGTVERLVESDCVRPDSGEKRKALKRWNKYQYGYGGNKLGCDEELASWHAKTVPHPPSPSLTSPLLCGLRPRCCCGAGVSVHFAAAAGRDGPVRQPRLAPAGAKAPDARQAVRAATVLSRLCMWSEQTELTRTPWHGRAGCLRTARTTTSRTCAATGSRSSRRATS